MNLFPRIRTDRQPQARAEVDEVTFRKDRALVRKDYIRVVSATKGLQKWNAEDDAFLDIIDNRIVELHRQAGRPVPMEVLEKPREVQDNADELLRRLADDAHGITPFSPPEPALDTRPVLAAVGSKE